MTPLERKVYDVLQHERIMSGPLPENYGNDTCIIAERLETSQTVVTRALRSLTKQGFATWRLKCEFDPHDTKGVWWWKTWKPIEPRPE